MCTITSPLASLPDHCSCLVWIEQWKSFTLKWQNEHNMTWFFAVLGSSVRGCGRDGVWHQWSGVLHSGSQAPVCSLQQRPGSGLLAPAHAEETERLQIGWEPQMHQRILLQWWDPDRDKAASRLFLCKARSAKWFQYSLSWREMGDDHPSLLWLFPECENACKCHNFSRGVQVTFSSLCECGMMRFLCYLVVMVADGLLQLCCGDGRAT